jgi:hypothetical protein
MQGNHISGGKCKAFGCLGALGLRGQFSVSSDDVEALQLDLDPAELIVSEDFKVDPLRCCHLLQFPLRI